MRRNDRFDLKLSMYSYGESSKDRCATVSIVIKSILEVKNWEFRLSDQRQENGKNR